MPQYLDQRLTAWMGRTLRDRSGQRIGKVDDIYTDDAHGYPEWLAVSTGRFGLSITFVPIAGATPTGDHELQVRFPKSLVAEAPVAGQDGRLLPEDVIRLYDHYGYDLEAEEVRQRLESQRRPATTPRFAAPPERVPPSAPPAAPEPAPAPPEAPAPRASAPDAAPVAAPAAPAAPARPPAPARPAPAEAPVTAAARAAARMSPEAPAPGLAAPAPAPAAAAPAPAPAPAPPPAAAPRAPAWLPSWAAAIDLDEPRPDPNSPLFWNHDDRIDSIRPPREPAGRR